MAIEQGKSLSFFCENLCAYTSALCLRARVNNRRQRTKKHDFPMSTPPRVEPDSNLTGTRPGRQMTVDITKIEETIKVKTIPQNPTNHNERMGTLLVLNLIQT